jgi:hypothetical protein
VVLSIIERQFNAICLVKLNAISSAASNEQNMSVAKKKKKKKKYKKNNKKKVVEGVVLSFSTTWG